MENKIYLTDNANIIIKDGELNSETIISIVILSGLDEITINRTTLRLELYKSTQDKPLIFLGFGKNIDGTDDGYVFRNSGTPYLDAGSIWKKYGNEYCSSLLENNKFINEVVREVDKLIIENIDLGKSVFNEILDTFNDNEFYSSYHLFRAVTCCRVIFENLVHRIAKRVQYEEQIKEYIKTSKADPILSKYKILWLDDDNIKLEYLYSSNEIENFDFIAYYWEIANRYCMRPLYENKYKRVYKTYFPDKLTKLNYKELTEVLGKDVIDCTEIWLSSKTKDSLIKAYEAMK